MSDQYDGPMMAAEIIKLRADLVLESERRERAVTDLLNTIKRAEKAEAEVERLLRAHPSLPPEQRELLHRFGNQLIAKLLHGPTVALRSSTASASDQQLMLATSRLFGLHEQGSETPHAGAPAEEQEG